MPLTVAESLERLLQLHDAAGSPLRRGLRAPVDEATLRGRFLGLSLEPPADLIELYGLHDGTEDPWALLVGDGIRFASSSTASESCVELRSTAAAIASSPWWELSERDLWRPGWFPVFPLTRSDESVVVDSDPVSRDFGRLRVIRWEATEERLVADSLADFLSAVADRFETLGSRWDGEARRLAVDDELVAQLGSFP